MTLTHFQAMLLFALIISVAFAFLSRQTARERFHYAMRAFLAFLLLAIFAGWLLLFLQR